MKKRLFAILLTLCMVLSLMPPVFAAPPDTLELFYDDATVSYDPDKAGGQFYDLNLHMWLEEGHGYDRIGGTLFRLEYDSSKVMILTATGFTDTSVQYTTTPKHAGYAITNGYRLSNLNGVTEEFTGTFRVLVLGTPTEDIEIYVVPEVRIQAHTAYMPAPENTPISGDGMVDKEPGDGGEAKLVISVNYKVNYNGNGNTAGTAPDEVTIPIASAATTPVAQKGDLVKTGSAFAGWLPSSTDVTPSADQLKVVEADGEAPSDTILIDLDTKDIPTGQTMAITGNTTLYAVWGADDNGNGIPDFMEGSYNVYLDKNNGTTQPSPRSFSGKAEGTSIALNGVTAPQRATKDGVDYIFSGWTVGAEDDLKTGDQERFDNLTVYGATPYVVAADDADTEGGTDITLYALWAEDANQNEIPDYIETAYTVKYDVNTGDEASKPADETLKLDGDKITLANDVTKAADGNINYVFLGWSEAKLDVLTLGDERPEGLLNAGSEYTVDADKANTDKIITLYAVWSENNGDTTDPTKPDVDETGVTLSYTDDQTAPTGTLPEAKEYATGKGVVTAGKTVRTWDKHVIAGWLPDAVPTEVISATGSAPEGMIPAGGTYTMPETDSVLHAVWADDVNDDGNPDYGEDKYIVSFYDQVNPAPVKKEIGKVVGSEIAVSKTVPTRTGFVLVGYDLDVIPDITVTGTIPTDMDIDLQTASATYLVAAADDTDNDMLISFYAVWAVDSNGNGDPDCDEDKYTLTLDANGGVAPDPSVFENLVAQNKVDLADPIRNDEGNTSYSFVGWTESADHSDLTFENKEVPNMVDDPYTVTKTTTLYAVWAADTNGNDIPDYEEPTYKVTYISETVQQGEVEEYYEKDTVNVKVTTIPTNGPEGKIFAGWISSVNSLRYHNGFGTGDDRVEATSPNSFTMPALDVTLTAKWDDDVNGNGVPDGDETNRYTVILRENGGNTSDPDKFTNQLNGQTITLPSTTRDKVGDMSYLFLGWSPDQIAPLTKNDKSSIPATLHNAGAYVVDRGEADEDNWIYQYAVWAEDSNGNGTPDYDEDQYTVIYSGNSNTEGTVPANAEKLLVGDTLEIADGSSLKKDKDGKHYAFLGWQKGGTAPADIESDDEADEPEGLLYKGDTLEVVSGDFDAAKTLTLYALYAIDENGNGIPDMNEDKVKLTYVDEHDAAGTLPLPEEKVEGGTVTLKAPEMTLDGYVFAGWSETAGLELFGYNAELPTEEFYAYDYEEETFSPATFSMPKIDTELYAVWARPESSLSELTLKIVTTDSSKMGNDGSGREDAGRFILQSVASESTMDIPYTVYEADGKTPHIANDYKLSWTIELAGGFEGKETMYGEKIADTLSVTEDTLTATVTAKKSAVYKITVSLTYMDGTPVEGENVSDYCFVIVPGDVNKSGGVSNADSTMVDTMGVGTTVMPTAGNTDFIFELADINLSKGISNADSTIIDTMALDPDTSN